MAAERCRYLCPWKCHVGVQPVNLVLQKKCHLIAIYSVSQKKSPPPGGCLTFFPKLLGIFSPHFTRLLYVPICPRLQIFIQLSPTLTKLCHIKLDHPVPIICSMSTIGQSTHVQTFAKVIDNFVDRCLWQVIPGLLQCTF